MDYRIDYGGFALAPPQPVRPGGAPLYATIDGRVASLGNGEVVFHDPATDRSHVMTEQVLAAMNLCRPFRPMEQHVAAVSAGLAGLQGQEAAVRRVLEGLAGRGLLVTDDAFLMQLGRSQSVELAPPTALFIRACDRPAQLRRLLASLAGHCRRFGSRYRVIVVDDSQSSELQREHADLLRHFGEQADCSIVHFGAARWSQVVESLSGELPDHAGALRALLQRDTRYHGRRGGGIGKNLIGLLAAGERYVLLDDDFVFPLRRHPEFVPGLALDARAWAVRSFGDQQSALDAGVDPGIDPLAMQLQLCGQTLGAALGQVEGFSLGRADLQGLAPSTLPALRADARIVATINGHRGAAGASGLSWVYMLDAAGRTALCADQQQYERLRGDPPVWFGTRSFLIGGGGNFTPFAVDNRRLLPPTSPFGRGEDALFNALVRLGDGAAQLLDVPYSIGHAQESRRDRDSQRSQAEVPDINVCLAELARHAAADLYAAEPAPRLRLFAARLDDLASGSEAGVVSYLREYLGYRRSTAIGHLQNADSSGPAPDYWSADLRALVEANGRAITERGPPRFAGWPQEAQTSDCATLFRREATVLADGMRAWPAAWQVALDQRERWLEPAA